MKKIIAAVSLLLLITAFMLPLAVNAASLDETQKVSLTAKLELAIRPERNNPYWSKGRVKVVTSFPDLKVKIVDSFPDLKIRTVSFNPRRAGEWRFVDYREDFRVQFVDAFEDIRIQFVS